MCNRIKVEGEKKHSSHGRPFTAAMAAIAREPWISWEGDDCIMDGNEKEGVAAVGQRERWAPRRWMWLRVHETVLAGRGIQRPPDAVGLVQQGDDDTTTNCGTTACGRDWLPVIKSPFLFPFSSYSLYLLCSYFFLFSFLLLLGLTVAMPLLIHKNILFLIFVVTHFQEMK